LFAYLEGGARLLAQHFGSAHTETKLQKIEEYLRLFTTVLKRQDFETVYIDAFAGTGAWKQGGSSSVQLDLLEFDGVAKGSARRALEVSPPFSWYVFIEQNRRKYAALCELAAEFPSKRELVKFVRADANAAIAQLCREIDWRRTRAVVFLDPFGMQVEWSTVETLAATRAVDLWYLVPTGIGINRQIPRVGDIPRRRGERIDRVLGTPEWRERFVKREQTPADLFGFTAARQVKATDAAAVTEFVMERLRTVFSGGVASNWLPLGWRGRPMYSLVFACANPSPKASSLALRLANAVLR
jgi:three-Cys-motif partner protein